MLPRSRSLFGLIAFALISCLLMFYFYTKSAEVSSSISKQNDDRFEKATSAESTQSIIRKTATFNNVQDVMNEEIQLKTEEGKIDNSTVKTEEKRENYTKKTESDNAEIDAQSSAKVGWIPKIIHHKWKTYMTPRAYKDWILTWKKNHPTWEHWWWDDAISRTFISKHFPKYQSLYTSYYYEIQRADAIRYFFLYEFGGLFKDLDIESLKPIEGLLGNKSCLISEEPEGNSYMHYGYTYTFTSNAFMACRPKHPFFKFLIENLDRNLRQFQTDLGKSTGPFMVNKMLKEYRAKYPNASEADQVTLIPGHYIHPALAPEVFPGAKSKCQEILHNIETGQTEEVKNLELYKLRIAFCHKMKDKDFKNVPGPEDYCNHHWSHSYLHPGEFTGQKSTSNFDIRDELTVINPLDRVKR